MRIIFNGTVALEILVSVIVGFIIGKILSIFGIHSFGNFDTAFLFGSLTLIIIDSLARLAKVYNNKDKAHKFFYPNRGGHVFFIPGFIVGVFILVSGFMN